MTPPVSTPAYSNINRIKIGEYSIHFWITVTVCTLVVITLHVVLILRSLEVICGDPNCTEQQVKVRLPSEAGLTLFQQAVG